MYRCFLCGKESLIWNSDFTYEEIYGKCDECESKDDTCYGLVSIHTCTSCNADATFSRKCDKNKEEWI